MDKTTKSKRPQNNKSRGKSKPWAKRDNNSTSDTEAKVRNKDFRKDSGCNDISWYAQDATLLRNVANFPWSTQAGLSYDDNYHVIESAAEVTDSGHKFTSPGIAAMHLIPGLGKTKYDVDAVNIAANAMYVFIRHMNSGAKNYDAPDLMNYILAMDEVFTFISFLQRLYGTLGMYNVYNRYMPDSLLKIQGVDPDDLRENMVNFRYRLNTIIKQAATLVVPNTFPIFHRHAFLFSEYYIEGSDMKDQVYLYTPVNFRKFNVPAGGGPGELIYEPLYKDSNGVDRYRLESNALTPKIKANELLDYLQDMVSRIYLDEDFGIMAGDILKAYGESNVVRLSELPDSYVCTLKQNNEVLLQFKNANFSEQAYRYFGTNRLTLDAYSPTFGEIHQDPNTNEIYENLSILCSVALDMEIFDKDRHLLTLEGDPSPEMNMIMTRLVHDYDLDNNLPGVVTYICGTELACHVSYVYDIDAYSVDEQGQIMLIGPNTPMVDAARLLCDVISSFKYHPCYHFLAMTAYPPTSSSDIYSYGRILQVDNFTIIQGDVLDRLNQVAIMSEFNVPHMALMS